MNYIRRDLETRLMQSMSGPNACFILGARQVGKTSLLKQLQRQVGEEQSLYYDIEFPQNLKLFSGSLEQLVSLWRIQRKYHDRRCFIFIDEIQYAADFSQKVKLLTDHYADEFKLIISGSSSALIKHQFQESLVGRKEIFILHPLSFVEFCRFKNEQQISELLQDTRFGKEHPLLLFENKMQELLAEHIIYGGYPEVVLKDTHQQKIDLLNEIVSSYVLKDIKNLFNIDKIEQLNRLISFLAANIGKELNLSNLSEKIGLHRETLQKYLQILKESYLIEMIKPYHKNIDKEIRKMPKTYFWDTGLRNAIVSNFSILGEHHDRGALAENFYFNTLCRNLLSHQKLHYWKTKQGQEIDFILQTNQDLEAFEVKYDDELGRHFAAFQNSYPQASCLTINYHYRYREDARPLWWSKAQ